MLSEGTPTGASHQRPPSPAADPIDWTLPQAHRLPITVFETSDENKPISVLHAGDVETEGVKVVTKPVFVVEP